MYSFVHLKLIPGAIFDFLVTAMGNVFFYNYTCTVHVPLGLLLHVHVKIFIIIGMQDGLQV